MEIVCPHCASPADAPESGLGPGGTMVECGTCGTRWLARVLAADPYARPTFARAAREAGDVSDAIVIEHVGPGFRAAETTQPRQRQVSRHAGQAAGDRRWRKGIAAVVGVVAALTVLPQIVAALPLRSASGLPAEVDLLKFQRIRSETVQHGGVSTLFVEGEIVNRSGAAIALPAIRIALKSAGGDEVYSWLVEPSAAGLAAGRTIGFRSAVASPPPGASQVTLKLAAREGQPIGPR